MNIKYIIGQCCYILEIFQEEKKNTQKTQTKLFIELCNKYDDKNRLIKKKYLSEIENFEDIYIETFIYHTNGHSILLFGDNDKHSFANYEKITYTRFLEDLNKFLNNDNKSLQDNIFLVNEELEDKNFIADCVYLDEDNDEVVSPSLFFNGAIVNKTHTIDKDLILTSKEYNSLNNSKDERDLITLRRKKLLKKAILKGNKNK